MNYFFQADTLYQIQSYYYHYWHCYTGIIIGTVIRVLILPLLYGYYYWHCYTGTIIGTVIRVLLLALLYGYYYWHCYTGTIIGTAIRVLLLALLYGYYYWHCYTGIIITTVIRVLLLGPCHYCFSFTVLLFYIRFLYCRCSKRPGGVWFRLRGGYRSNILGYING